MTKRFDAVAFMRQRREEIDREDAALTWAEKSLKTLQQLQGNPLWERLKTRTVPTGQPLSPERTAHPA
jgi:hypothetical protein